jgi:hypothetical protein
MHELSEAMETLDELDADIASVAPVYEDIFSTAGSLSTNSTVSTRVTAIDHIVSVFVADSELASLYAQAAKRLGQERFVRSQRRLLKKYFLDLRSRTQSQLHEQAIRILRGRSERTSIAEQIWIIISASDKSKRADMVSTRSCPDRLEHIRAR